MNELHAQGQTIVLTTHYMEEADQLCDRVAIIDHGQLLALDTPGAAQGERRAPTPSCASRPSGDLEALANDLAAMPGIDSTRVLDDTVFAYVSPDGPTLADVIAHAQRARLHDHRRVGVSRRRSRPCSSTSPEGSCANDAPPSPRRRTRRAPRSSRGRRSSRSMLRDLRVLYKELGIFIVAHDHPAVPAGVRVHVRVPEDRPVDRWRTWRRDVLDVARRRRDREHDDLPGRAGGRAADGAGLRLHA